VESILNQTFTDFEFLIVDDGSTDGTWEILQEYAARDARIMLIRNEKNIGLTRSLNNVLARAQGEYIARQDADDVSLPERLERQVKFLDEHPEVVLVSSNIECIDAEGRTLRQFQRAARTDLIAWHLLFYNYLGGHSLVMFRRKPVMDLGGYSEDRPYCQDYELWSRLVEVGDIVILPDVLLQWRSHGESISAKARSEQRAYALVNARNNIARWIGEELDPAEVAELRGFWLEGFPETQRVKALHITLKRLYRAFLQKHAKEGSTDPELACQLRRSIGERFVRWVRVLNIRQRLVSKIKVSFYAFLWHPRGVVDCWLSEFQSVLRYLFRALVGRSDKTT
jgi:glycosyltransferase involved in cell wall biosynthesis